MKMQECRKSGIYNVGFMDRNVIHEESVHKWPNRTKNNIFMSLEGQHDRTFILLPYNFKWVISLFESLQLANKCIYLTFLYPYVCINSFHWILLVIEIDRSRVTVWDSLRKPPELYQNLIDLMQRAWSRFLKTQLGVTSTLTELESSQQMTYYSIGNLSNKTRYRT